MYIELAVMLEIELCSTIWTNCPDTVSPCRVWVWGEAGGGCEEDGVDDFRL